MRGGTNEGGDGAGRLATAALSAGLGSCSQENLGIRISSITRAITKRYSTPSQLVGKAGITFKRRADMYTRDTQRIRWQRHFSQVFLGKSMHAQTVITRPLTEGCGLEARLEVMVLVA